jgi:hypothetical protein
VRCKAQGHWHRASFDKLRTGRAWSIGKYSQKKLEVRDQTSEVRDKADL